MKILSVSSRSSETKARILPKDFGELIDGLVQKLQSGLPSSVNSNSEPNDTGNWSKAKTHLISISFICDCYKGLLALFVV